MKTIHHLIAPKWCNDLPDAIGRLLDPTWQDFGIGQYEYWGQKCRDRQMAPTLGEPVEVDIDYSEWMKSRSWEDTCTPSRIEGTLMVEGDERDAGMDWVAHRLSYDEKTHIARYRVEAEQ